MTRKLIAYSLMVFYIAFQLRPLTVVISDVLAHTFFRAQHMATIHFENGKYHVHTDLKAVSDEERGLSRESSAALKKANEGSVHTVRDFRIQFNPLFSEMIISPRAVPAILPPCIQIELPPPRA